MWTAIYDMNRFNQISVTVVLFCYHQHEKILFYFFWNFFPVSQVFWETLYLGFIYYLFRTTCKCFYLLFPFSHAFSLSILAYFVFKVKMSIINPLVCGFAEVVVFSVLWSKTELQKKIGGYEKELKSRELKYKFE